MNKTELAQAISRKTGLSKKSSESAVGAITEAITEALVSGNAVRLMGFGVFEVRERMERYAYSPKTRERIIVPKSKLPVFKPSKVLKDSVLK